MTSIEDGHFTTMQVRRRAVQGLGLHLQRLSDATRELFDVDLDETRLRAAMLSALDAQRSDEGTLRVTVGAPDSSGLPMADGRDLPRIVTSLTAPLVHAAQPMRLGSVEHQRALAHIKHVGTFASHHYRRRALRDGLDDVLFVDTRKRVLEGSFWNIGFWRGLDVVWPEGPALRGIGAQLLKIGLGATGVAQSTEIVTLDSLLGLDGGFIVNARGMRAVASVDGCEWRVALTKLAMRRLQAIRTRTEWEPLQI